MSSSRYGAEHSGEGYAAAAASVLQVMADLERCKPGTRLAERPEPDQDLVITGLLRRLWRPAPDGDRFRPPSVMCDQWAHEFELKTARGRSNVDPGLAAEGIAAFRFLARSAPRHVPSLHRPAHRQRAGGRTGTVAGDRPQTLRR